MKVSKHDLQAYNTGEQLRDLDARESVKRAAQAVRTISEQVKIDNPSLNNEELGDVVDGEIAEIIVDSLHKESGHEDKVQIGLVGVMEELDHAGGEVPSALSSTDPLVLEEAFGLARQGGVSDAYLAEVARTIDESSIQTQGLHSHEGSSALIESTRELTAAYGLTGQAEYMMTIDPRDEIRQLYDRVRERFDTAEISEEKQGQVRDFLMELSHDKMGLEKTMELANQGVALEDIATNGRVFIDNMTRLDGLGKSGEAARTMALDLAKCRGFKLIQDDSLLFEKLTEDPESCRDRVELIVGRWSEVVESGCPPEIASLDIMNGFNKYAYVNRLSFNEPLRDELYGRSQRALEAAIVVGDLGYQAKSRKTSGRNDGFIGEVANRMINEHFDEAKKRDIRQKLTSYIDAYDFASNEAPMVAEIARSINYLSGEYIDDLGDIGLSMMAVAKREDKLKSLSQDTDHFRINTATSLRSIYDSLQQARREGRDMEAETVGGSIDVAHQLHLTEPRYSPDVTRYILGSSNEDAIFRSERLLRTDVRQLIDSERGLNEIENSLYVIGNKSCDIDGLMTAYNQTRTPLRGLLKEMAIAQPYEASLMGSKANETYYQILPEEMNKVDKNGTPYSSPDSVAQIARYLGKDGSDKARQMVEWYRRDTLPLSAFDVVHKMRERIVASGAEDSPTAIYDYYCNNSELIADMSAENLIGYTNGELEMSAGHGANWKLEIWAKGRDVSGIIEAARQSAIERQDSFRLFINMRPDALVASVGSGTIKSIMDTDIIDYDKMQDRGANYVFHRSAVEVMMGNRSVGSKEHPIYGSCGFVDRGIPTGAIGYGEVMLSIRSDTANITNKVTFTPEDSFHGTYRLTMEDAATLRVIKNAADLDHANTANYIEAQIQGGVNLSLVETIYVQTEEVAKSLRENLPAELASKVQLRQSEYDNTIEMFQFDKQFGVRPEPAKQEQVSTTSLSREDQTKWTELADDDEMQF